MDSAVTIFNQIIKMFVMMAVGFGLTKNKTINEETTARLSSLLLMVATPCTILNSFNQTYSQEKLAGLALSFGLSVLVYSMNILVASVLFEKEARVEKFSAVFSNAGFLGIPLVTGLLGAEAVFYLSPFIVCFYLFAWTYGALIMSGNRESVTMKKIATNPCIWATVLGIGIFLCPLKPAAPLMEAVASLGSMNTPLAMLILGAYMAKSSISSLFRNKKAYWVCFVRLILIPGLLLVGLPFVPDAYATIRTVILVAASAPVGALAPVFAQMFGKDIQLGAEIVSLSTIFCLITMPVVLLAAEIVW